MAVCVCTFAGRVKQCGLERDDLHIVQVFLDGHLNRKASVWVHVGKGQQICGAHKEVSVERVDGQTCRETERDEINQTGLITVTLNCQRISPNNNKNEFACIQGR